jgi:hypothetical protein
VKRPNFAKILELWPAKVLALAAALLLFLFNRFDSLQVKTLTVPLRVVTDTALLPAQEFSHRVRVTVRGAEDVVSDIGENDLEAHVDFSGHQGEGVYTAPIQVTRRGETPDSPPIELAVDPLNLTLHLERKVVKTVNVRPDFQGEPARNFVLSGFQVVPASVTVEGPRSAVDKLQSVTTEAIELRGKTDSFTLKARLDPGPLVDFPYGNTVEIQGIMSSSLASLVLDNVAPTVVNLHAGLRLENPLPSVRVRLRGTAAALAALPKDAHGSPTVPITADLTGFALSDEVPSVELKAELPDGVELVDLSPAVVPVVLESKP